MQVPHDHHVTGPNTPNTSLDEWWEGEIDTIVKEVNHQVSAIINWKMKSVYN